MKKLNEEKSSMWKDNQALAQEYQTLKTKFSQLEEIYRLKNNDLERERQ